MSDFLILGKNGQLGRAFAEVLGARATALDRQAIDLADSQFASKLAPYLQRGLRAVINAAAYTQVDKAEGEGRTDAFRINAQAAGELARLCAAHGVPLVHYSTDYVFDGSGDAAWRETDPTHPLNVYGQSKCEGERLIAEAGGQHLILRTSWVYDATGKNFFTAMRRLFEEKESIGVINDQIGAPTYAPHLAKASLAIVENALSMQAFPSAIYHLCAGGETSWHGFAQAILALATSGDYGNNRPIQCNTINPIPATSYPLPARRPYNSRLDCAKARSLFGIAMPHWREGLAECSERAYGRARLPDNRIENHPPAAL